MSQAAEKSSLALFNDAESFETRLSTPLDKFEAKSNKLDFFNYPIDELANLVQEKFSEPGFRAVQLFNWVYNKEVTDIAQMSNITKGLREKLEETFFFPKAKINERLISQDGTRKYLFEVDNGDLVESVMIKQPNRMTLCVSSQVGCGMGCEFCRTATMGFRRNLSTSEIIRQVIGVIEDAKNFGDMFTNIVFMGMGEPLHNYKGVTNALKILTEEQGLKMGPRKITVSSVGLVPAIRKFGESGVKASLAISLNATTDEVRSQIMPINKRFPISTLLECLRSFPLSKRGLITIEYVMLAGINDSDEDLKRLPRLLRGVPAKVNLIPYNENAGLGFKSPSHEKVTRWQREISKTGLHTTIRWSKGADIKAACGQLATHREVAAA